MILPTKGIAPDKALLSIGAFILQELDEPKTVSRLWADLRRVEEGPPDLTFSGSQTRRKTVDSSGSGSADTSRNWGSHETNTQGSGARSVSGELNLV